MAIHSCWQNCIRATNVGCLVWMSGTSCVKAIRKCKNSSTCCRSQIEKWNKFRAFYLVFFWNLVFGRLKVNLGNILDSSEFWAGKNRVAFQWNPFLEHFYMKGYIIFIIIAVFLTSRKERYLQLLWQRNESHN